MKGLERLEIEVLEMNNCNISAIFNYLKTRNDLYEKFNNEEKSIHQMYEFIYKKAEKQKIGNVAMISDRIVYLWAVTYFIKSNEELGLNEKKVMPPSSDEVIKNIEKKKSKKEEKAPEEDKQKNDQITFVSGGVKIMGYVKVAYRNIFRQLDYYSYLPDGWDKFVNKQSQYHNLIIKSSKINVIAQIVIMILLVKKGK